MRKKKEVKLPSVWMTVYSDFLTNEMLFFMMLFGMACISLQKGYTKEQYKEFLEGVSSSVRKGEVKNQKIENLRRQISLIKEIPAVTVSRKSMRIVLPEPVLFKKGKAVFKKTAPKTLKRIGKILSGSSYKIFIEGHTCDLPIHQKAPPNMMRWQLAMARSSGKGPYFSNRELAGARALQVLRFFLRNKLIHPERMSVSAFGPSEPLVPNTNERNRRLNRRIEIRIELNGVS